MPRASSPPNHHSRLYLTVILFCLGAGGLMLFFQKQPASLHCPAIPGLADSARGEVAAFIPIQKPQTIPDFSFRDADGRLRHIGEFRGKTVLVNLWATWCVPCRTEMPALDGLQQKRGSDNFEVVALSLDSGGASAPQKFLSDIKIKSLPFYHDQDGRVFPALRRAGLIGGLPTSLLLGRNGCVQGVLAGAADWKSDDALRLIDTALDNQRVGTGLSPE